MDVVYPVRDGANEELRYSLRSLTNVPHDRVWIIGGGPSWLTNVEHIRRPRLATKYLTTTAHLRAACEHDGISDPFILCNDDFYIVEPVAQIPPLHRGPVDRLIDIYRTKGNGPYVAGMEATRDLLHDLGYHQPMSYELHIPIVIHKAAMRKAIEAGSHLPVLHKRTLYGNLAELGGVEVNDVKVYDLSQRIPTGSWLSSCDTAFPPVRRLLTRAFPYPCEYET